MPPEELETRRTQLDGLLEKYLELLDEYEIARTELSKHMSSGFFDLARANHSGTKRYGQDYYDYRMQAQETVTVKAVEASKGSTATSTSERHEATDPPELQISITRRLAYTNEDGESVKLKDPLTWYGLLTPNPLRSAQTSFTQSVEHAIPRVLNATSQLRHLEIEIGRLRKYIRKLEKSAET